MFSGEEKTVGKGDVICVTNWIMSSRRRVRVERYSNLCSIAGYNVCSIREIKSKHHFIIIVKHILDACGFNKADL